MENPSLGITVAERVVEICERHGAPQSEAFFVTSYGTSIKVFDLNLESFRRSEHAGVGIRVFKGDKIGRSYTTDVSEGALIQAVENAIASADISEPDLHIRLPEDSYCPKGAREGGELGSELDIWQEDPDDISAEEKIEFTLNLERNARAFDPRVKGVETAFYSDSASNIVIANSLGFRAGYRTSSFYGYLIAIAEEDGEFQTGFGFTAARRFSRLEGDAASEEAAGLAVSLLGSSAIETKKMPLILRNLPAAEIIAAVAFALSADAVVKGRSYLADRIGESVGSDLLNLEDDGTIKGGFGTAPFDDEGVRMTRKTLIERGVLKGFLHNCYTASRMGCALTGNASRASFRDNIGVSPTNLYIPAGGSSFEELRAGIENGLEVTELQGVHVGLNPVTGEISVGVKGIFIRNGKPDKGVREVTVAGKMEDFLKGLIAIGNDLRFIPLRGGIGAPSIVVKDIVVAGR